MFVDTGNLVKEEEANCRLDTVFAQWIPVLAILGRMVFQNGFKFLYLWGEMDPIRQDMCIRAFQERPEIKILVSQPAPITNVGFTN